MPCESALRSSGRDGEARSPQWDCHCTALSLPVTLFSMIDDRLHRQLGFIMEIDRLKGILRQTLLTGSRRQENDAEHSWHMAMMAVLLSEYANEPVDVLRVVKMILVHDIVEIDAGDTYCYDAAAAVGKADRERKAADRIFNLLPSDQAAEMRGLWDEFETRSTPESRFANALDRLQPVMLNYFTDGVAWRSHDVSREAVLKRNSPIGDGAAKLWEYAKALIDDAVRKGYLRG